METENEKPLEVMPEAKKSAPGWQRAAFFILIPLVIILLGTAGYMAMQLKNESDAVQKSLNVVPPVSTPVGEAVTPVAPVPDHTVGTWVSVSWTNPWKAVAVDCGSGDAATCDVSATKQFNAGAATSGEYKGQIVYIQEEQMLGSSYRYFVKSGGKNIYFDEANIKITGIDDLPEYIQLPGSDQKLRRFTTQQSIYKDLKHVNKILSDPTVGDVYLSDTGDCFIAELPNGLAVSYSLVVPFASVETGIPQITFEDGKVNVDNYNHIIPSCGWLCDRLALVEEKDLQPSTRLEVVGTAGSQKIYGIKDPNDKVLKDIYNDKNTIPYSSTTQNSDGTYQNSKNKYTYQQFIALRPLLYWKDALGRWIEFRNARVAVAAEMCKPVIYLYPTKDTNLKIEVAPNGGLTKTIPEYGTGWEVTAHPTGKITDRKTGQIYDYLFWEGIGMQYPTPTEGFIVSTKDLSSFFDRTLPRLGLAGREITDFKEYWVARLQNTGKPYALVSFMDPLDFAALAPVAITGQQPTSTIRVMMTAKALDAKISIPEQKLAPTPVRRGFVYAEWGGALLQ